MNEQEYNNLRVGDTIQRLHGPITGKITHIQRESCGAQKAFCFSVEWNTGLEGTYGADFFKHWVRSPESQTTLPSQPGFYWFKGRGKDWYGVLHELSCPVHFNGFTVRVLTFGGELVKTDSFKGEWVELTEEKVLRLW